MLSLKEAVERSLAAAPLLDTEAIPLVDTTGRFAAVDAIANVALPGFDNSAMDGYAVRSCDLRGATAESPVALNCLGVIPAGAKPSGTVDEGICMRIFTGSPIPLGADAVIMQEDCSIDPGEDGIVRCNDSVKPWENVRLKGEDVREGDTVVAAGARITVGTIGLLAATGHGSLEVGLQPKVGLVVTGNELVEPPGNLQPGEIYESNRAMLASLVARANGLPTRYPVVPDSLEATKTALERAFAENDAVVTSGGVSVGDHDHVRPAIERLGGSLDFWKVAVKPGKPFVLGQADGKPLFGLPGNPVSALVTFLLLVRPALLKMQGATDCRLAKRPGRLADELANRGDRRHFVRVTLDADGLVRGAGGQRSHMLGSLAKANGLVDLPPESRLAKGDPVEVLLIDG
ncbi:MAG: molybdopterin molybdotransferase MoeA [Verrucomicrobiota bacterium]|jgi:molybdopterin molybdotransferase|nr:molybdopterin molybdotransferase MoeA [Verrucomicrobiota bacterium]MDP6754084.1 molybdopterin molybdotransferase MoeA [Verrucomicrobiota bacterium]MDP7012512.1 molybdopterin molybdotransferase MoeA [Verrucomicrobiota bacterium]